MYNVKFTLGGLNNMKKEGKNLLGIETVETHHFKDIPTKEEVFYIAALLESMMSSAEDCKLHMNTLIYKLDKLPIPLIDHPDQGFKYLKYGLTRLKQLFGEQAYDVLFKNVEGLEVDIFELSDDRSNVRCNEWCADYKGIDITDHLSKAIRKPIEVVLHEDISKEYTTLPCKCLCEDQIFEVEYSVCDINYCPVCGNKSKTIKEPLNLPKLEYSDIGFSYTYNTIDPKEYPLIFPVSGPFTNLKRVSGYYTNLNEYRYYYSHRQGGR